GVLEAGTAKLYLNTGSGFSPVTLVSEGGDTWRADLPNLTCGTTVSWYVAADSNRITFRDPPAAPGKFYTAVVGTTSANGFTDDMETDRGWVVGAAGDTATQGLWTRAVPVASAAQPGADVTPGAATMCFVTGNAAAGAPSGTNDVDGGRTTLTSPA